MIYNAAIGLVSSGILGKLTILKKIIGELIENEGTMIIPNIGYIIAFLSQIIGLIYGAVLIFSKKTQHYTKNMKDS